MVQSDQPCVVSENNKSLGMMLLTIQLSAGRHKLKVSTVAGDKSQALDVTIRSGEQLTRKVALTE